MSEEKIALVTSLDGSKIGQQYSTIKDGASNCAEDSNRKTKTKNTLVTISYTDRSEMLHTTSNFATFMHLIRSNVGTGMLAMPVAVLSAGLWVGTFGIFVIGLLCVYSMHLLVNSCHTLCDRTGSMFLDYAGVMEKALETGPRILQKFSKGSKYMVNTFLVMTQFGFCSIYIVFVASNIKYVVERFYEDDPDIRIYMLVLVVILVPYLFIRHLTILAFFSTFGNVLLVVCLAIILQYIVRDLPDVSVRPAFNSTQYLPMFIGSCFYTFEGIGTLLPVENKMATPEDLGGWTGVLNLAMISATCLYTAMGFYGYLKFGQASKGSITLSLPQDNWLYLSVNLMFAFIMTLTFALLVYVPHSITWPWLEQKLNIKRYKTLAETAFRICILLFTAVLAIVVPHIDLLIALVGAAASSTLDVIFPATIDLLVRWTDKRLTVGIVLLDALLLTIGIFGFVSGTIVSLKEIIETF